MSKILQCKKCNIYTLENNCLQCNLETVKSAPPSFSLKDKYGKYRRIYKRQGRNK